jgi:hypothetical protein
MREKDELDLLLDSALSTYADPGPHYGLEDRILAEVAAARMASDRPATGAKSRSRWLAWAIGIPVAACLLWWITAGKIKYTPSARPEQAYTSNHTQTPLAAGAIAAPGPTTARKIRPSGANVSVNCAASSARLTPPQLGRPVAGDPGKSCPGATPKPSVATDAHRTAPLPKLDVFPTPQPLTAEEETLLAFAQQAPAGQVEALSTAQTRDEEFFVVAESFVVAASHVPSLEPPHVGKN